MKWITLTSLYTLLFSYSSLIAQEAYGQTATSSPTTPTNSTLPLNAIGTSTAAQIKLYPNPSNGFFKVQCTEGIQELRIINVLGQELLHLENLGHQIQEIKLDGEEFEGIHSLYIRDTTGRETIEQLSIF